MYGPKKLYKIGTADIDVADKAQQLLMYGPKKLYKIGMADIDVADKAPTRRSRRNC